MNPRLPGAALLLDGRRDDEPTLALAHDALADGLAAGGWAVDDWRLRDDKIAWCAGCFKCWTTTPGECAHHDDGRAVAERWVRSDLVVFLTPVTFGGYSSELKKALDHVLPILLPTMGKRGGETHHPQRYERRRDLLVVG
ncbi:MAG: NAD(P)H-dependent oxidoreductase, partial [Actinomycetes bacterium]